MRRRQRHANLEESKKRKDEGVGITIEAKGLAITVD